MPELSTASFRRIAILGTGLMGGSFGLAAKRYIPDAHIVGYDREPTIEQARARGAIDLCESFGRGLPAPSTCLS